jgi:hypothetical protein
MTHSTVIAILTASVLLFLALPSPARAQESTAAREARLSDDTAIPVESVAEQTDKPSPYEKKSAETVKESKAAAATTEEVTAETDKAAQGG